MTTNELSSRLVFMEFSDTQRATLRASHPILRAIMGGALDRFYARAAKTPETARFFRNAAHMGQAKAAQAKHWEHIAQADFDGTYHASTRRIGSTHARIGLEPRWYVGSYAILIEEFLAGVHRHCAPWRRALNLFRTPSARDASIAIAKAAVLDMEVSLTTYVDEAQADRNMAVQRIEKALDALAGGDLTNELDGMPAGFTDLERAYNSTLAKMRTMIGAVGEGTARLNSGIGEIAQASEDLARRTESNAASLEETNAAVGQMETRLKTTAHAARQTVSRADQAISTVGDGRGIADLAVQAMGRVSDSAKGIDNVIEGLDKIAFQTRVLAMNAAVEAGRAGEAGRGFAVVADLVSALAMRAEEEAQRAREQLTTTQDEISTAVEAVQKVDNALADISGDVGQVHQLLATMAEDNSAQSIAVTEISSAIGTMDRATQQNAAMVEETSAAARTLSAEVAELAERASAFIVTGKAGNRGKANGTTALLPPVRPLPAAAISALTRPDA
ncbi:protoglobin domain-containing protein [Sphingomonas sp. dw_22]|uniref:protoglobin domain-containing protein n=1 Tax=Sphingomonas sp. dw_22 TaxID=2721175 RepID=UPI0031FE5F55